MAEPHPELHPSVSCSPLRCQALPIIPCQPLVYFLLDKLQTVVGFVQDVLGWDVDVEGYPGPWGGVGGVTPLPGLPSGLPACLPPGSEPSSIDKLAAMLAGP